MIAARSRGLNSSVVMGEYTTVVFDLGGVLIQWDPRNLYRKLLSDEAAVEDFLANVCTPAWNEKQDAGRTFSEAEKELIAVHADKEHLIRAFGSRFDEMIPGANEDVVEILMDLKARNTPVFALTNWSAETFVSQKVRFPFLNEFDGILVSGEERLIKPDVRIFKLLLNRYGLDPKRTVFIDDVEENTAAASVVGIHGIQFNGAATLRNALEALGFL
jgi:2-haloacid dehalogenase